ncbi:MAG: phosphatidylserine decarboxylase [Chlamydiota bacterium]
MINFKVGICVLMAATLLGGVQQGFSQRYQDEQAYYKLHPYFELEPYYVEQPELYRPVTQELIALVEGDDTMRHLLESSLAQAKEVNPSEDTNPAQRLAEYYYFIDRVVDIIPTNLLEQPGKLARDRIEQSILYFYFLIDQPLPELENKGLYKNTLQYYPPFAAWLEKFAKAWGHFLSTDQSWSPEIYQEFYEDPSFGLQQGWYESPKNWHTFNDFFSRHLRSTQQRPIASPSDAKVVISPVDATPQGVWKIGADSEIIKQDGLNVKQAKFYDIEELLGEDSQYKEAFANGTLTHAYLNINDYHRYHFPVAGTIKEKKIIHNNVALGAAWDSDKGQYIPVNRLGWQANQTRGYVIVDNDQYGLVALMPVGLAQVSSINFEENVDVGTTHQKGDKLGYFLFGGSDFIILFQDKANFKLEAPQKDNGFYQHMLMGQKYGLFNN